MLSDFESIIQKAQKKGRRQFVIAGGGSPEVLKAVDEAFKLGIMNPVLVGYKSEILTLADKLNIITDPWQIENAEDETGIADVSAQLLSEGTGEILAKGNMSTPVLLKAALKEKYGLRNKHLLSHISLMRIPAYHKLIIITDSGMVIQPTLEQKIDILKNAIDVFHRLGKIQPKISLLAANEKVSEKMPETIDAVLLADKAKIGVFGDVIMEGPMAVDIAFSKEAAETKNVKSVTAGDPDILLVPNVVSGNMFCKGLIYLAQSQIAGIIAGAKVPIVLISRAETSETMLRSAALASILV